MSHTNDGSRAYATVTATRDLFNLIPNAPSAGWRCVAVFQTHIQIGESVIRNWLDLVSHDDDLILAIDGTGMRDAFMTLLYSATGWLHTVSSLRLPDEPQLRLESSSLQRLRAQGLHVAAALLTAVGFSGFAHTSMGLPVVATDMAGYNYYDMMSELLTGPFSSVSEAASVNRNNY